MAPGRDLGSNSCITSSRLCPPWQATGPLGPSLPTLSYNWSTVALCHIPKSCSLRKQNLFLESWKKFFLTTVKFYFKCDYSCPVVEMFTFWFRRCYPQTLVQALCGIWVMHCTSLLKKQT